MSEQSKFFEDSEPEEKKKNYPVSIYLTEDEKEIIEQLAEENGISRHALLQYAVLDFVKRYRKNPDIMKMQQKPAKPEL